MGPGLSYLGIVDKLWSNWNQSCLTDPRNGMNCNDYISSFPDVDDITQLSKDHLCSDAYTNLYGNEFESMLRYVATSCHVFSVTAKDSVTDICVSSNYYTTKQGDTCDSIALTHKVSAATLYHLNDNIINCTSIASGARLCLPLSCNSLYSVQPDDDCSSIAADAGIYTRQFLSYNTALTLNCTNLHSTNPYWGRTSLNHTQPEDFQSVGPPTGAWHLNDGSLQCVQICLQYQIPINLLTAANPSLGKATCDQDLVKGDAYCVNPIPGWGSVLITA
ncbi:hypothetical protein HDV64DRAFT_272902 [Trichoderma sp. TUCIM 5745]